MIFNQSYLRTLSKFLKALSISGCLISLVFITFLVIVAISIVNNLSAVFSNITEALAVTDAGLVTLDGTLTDIDSSITTASSSIDNAAGSLQSITPMIDTMSIFLGEDLPAIVINAQGSLDSAASSSLLIDNTLGFLASIPLVNLDYRPEVPLHMGLQTLSSTLDGLPTTFKNLQNDLSQAGTNLQTTADTLVLLSQDVIKISGQVHQAQQVITSYRGLIKELNSTVKLTQQDIITSTKAVTILLMVLFTWLMTFQVGMFFFSKKLSQHLNRAPGDA